MIGGLPGLQARVTLSVALKGLNQCSDGLNPGDELEVRIEGDGIAVSRVPNCGPASPTPEEGS